jgi:hypothetical protein
LHHRCEGADEPEPAGEVRQPQADGPHREQHDGRAREEPELHASPARVGRGAILCLACQAGFAGAGIGLGAGLEASFLDRSDDLREIDAAGVEGQAGLLEGEAHARLRDAIELRERTLDGRGAVVAMHSADVEDDLPKRGLLGAGG